MTRYLCSFPSEMPVCEQHFDADKVLPSKKLIGEPSPKPVADPKYYDTLYVEHLKSLYMKQKALCEKTKKENIRLKRLAGLDSDDDKKRIGHLSEYQREAR